MPFLYKVFLLVTCLYEIRLEPSIDTSVGRFFNLAGYQFQLVKLY
jgi:hypothetical protein